MRDQLSRFNEWMINVAKIDVFSEDLYAQGLARDYWKVWQAATASVLPTEDEMPCETLFMCEAHFDTDTGWTCRSSPLPRSVQIDSLYGPDKY